MRYAGNRFRDALKQRLVRSYEIIDACPRFSPEDRFAANINGIHRIRAMNPPLGVKVHRGEP
jgi:hypothetical protein